LKDLGIDGRIILEWISETVMNLEAPYKDGIFLSR